MKKTRKKKFPYLGRKLLYDSDTNDLALIIDGSNMFLRSAKVPSLSILTNSKGQKTGALYGTLKSIIKEISVWRPDHIYFVLDKGGSVRKETLCETYKANRDSHNPNKIYTQDERHEHEENNRQLEILRKILNAMSVKVVCIRGIEGDDIIGALINAHDFNVICSTDTDFLQLHNGVNCFVYSPWKRVCPPPLKEGLTLYGSSYAVLKSIVGDKSDNIVGLNRIGWKTVNKWCLEQNHYPINLKELKDQAKSYHTKLSSKILENWDIIEKNYQLIVLDIMSTDMLPTLSVILKDLENQDLKLDFNKIRGLLAEEEIRYDVLSEIICIFQNK